MAGAVSAGAYSAGVLDYLFETLELWERAKQKNRSIQQSHPESYFSHPEYDPTVPMHEVEIDLMAGSSAGGISGSLAFLSLSDLQYLHPDDFPGNELHYKNQLLYRCWVTMDDDAKGSTLEKMLALDDIKKAKLKDLPALFNVKPIEDIADRAFAAVSKRLNQAFPPYIHPDLDLLLTVTNLDGLPFHISFTGDSVAQHTLIQHAAFMGYRRLGPHSKAPLSKNEPYFYPLNLTLEQHMQYLKEFTLSTAAFPIALKARQPAIPGKFLEQYRTFLFGRSESLTEENLAIPVDENKYSFLASDGGIINNKPFGLATVLMKAKAPEHLAQDRYAVIMIDPLPREEAHAPTQGAGIFAVAKAMFNALRNQAFFHQIGLNEVLKLHNRTRFMIVPRRKFKAPEQAHLASASLFGFAGFLNKSFREHDYLLGRKNCQDFLRYYFAVEVDQHEKRLGKRYNAASSQKYAFTDQASQESMLPIIPDLRIEKTLSEASKLGYPAFPNMDTEQLHKLIDQDLMDRIKVLVNMIELPFLLKLPAGVLKPILYSKLRKLMKKWI